ncbi:proton-conducting membrane transporter [Crassaminicella thermophila]|uniref:Proton-conducting membrane transporter n=1 Tax=Crassaminicella thermophila TaxID=2599308 RepID=A0A5C0SI67_CRATE|nr:4Fe-4S dicluster domain-containing protein [Crassaminicella thermophila]QEK12639.1 proton-conducting membrane transporter [Crassaminicella thermophila]
MELIQKIFDAGVVGAGGAGFPTYIKLNCKVEYLIINAAECEPLLETDKYLMRTKNMEIIKTIEEVGKIIEAKKLIIGLKAKYKEEIKQLIYAIEELNSKVELYFLENFYPAGDEQIMVYEITKRSIPSGGIPLDVGVVVSNVGTIVNIYDAMQDKPVIEKYITVVGEINHPSILKVPIGISILECIRACGGTTVENFKVILGGPIMGVLVDNDQIKERVITKTIGALIVIPSDHYIAKRKNASISHIINQAKTSCIQCSMCTDMCPRNLIGHKLRPHRIMRSVGMGECNEKILEESLICSECGVCELYACPMGLSPRMVNAYLKKRLREMGIRYENKQKETIAKKIREYRKVPTTRMISRLDLTKYKEKEIKGPIEVEVEKVCIPLSQHIGKPATPNIGVGDIVRKGQLIGQVKMGDFGANIHASIDGRVCEVSENIVIRSENNEVIS